MKQESSSERKAYKDYFDKAAAIALGEQIERVSKEFDKAHFVKLAANRLGELEFHARVRQFADALAKTLPDDVPAALNVLTASLPPEMTDCEAITDGWLQWPIGQFIGYYGVDYLNESMDAMIELTKRFSAEYPILQFIDRYPEEVFRRLGELTKDSNPHVRRWCSEGMRTRLPWRSKAVHLIADPSPIWPILEALKDDGELYVRRSVANNLNDLSKDHPALVLDRCEKWSKKSDVNRDWVIKHALRSLIKDGDPRALKIIGFGEPEELDVEFRIQPKSILLGESIVLDATFKTGSARDQKLLVDYRVHYVRKGGKSSVKVFKWKVIDLPKKSVCSVLKKHAMKVTTVRVLYPGMHRVELQVNGSIFAEASFQLEA